MQHLLLLVVVLLVQLQRRTHRVGAQLSEHPLLLRTANQSTRQQLDIPRDKPNRLHSCRLLGKPPSAAGLHWSYCLQHQLQLLHQQQQVLVRVQ